MDQHLFSQLFPGCLLTKLRYGRYLDILVAHSPPFGIHNGEDRIHVGFKAFIWLLKVFKPAYMVHGHRHVYNPLETTETQFYNTRVLNIYPYKLLRYRGSAMSNTEPSVAFLGSRVLTVRQPP